MKIQSLTATRAIAAIMVVIHHYGSDLYPFSLCGNLFHSGNLAVGYFFVLSGFVLYISQKKIAYLKFIKNRLARIAPAYLIALILMIAVLICFYPPPDTNIFQQIICSALFIQSFFPAYVLELNSPAWSVSVEMFFYLLFPLLLYIKDTKKIIYLTIVAYLASQIVHIYYAPKIWDLTGSGIYFNPLIHLNQFLIGISGAIIFEKRPSVFKQKYLSLFFVAFLVVLILVRPLQISYGAGLMAPIYLMIILCIASSDICWLNNKILVYLGEVSFGIYIYQMPVYKMLQRLNIVYWHQPKYVSFYCSFAILVIIAILSYHLVEQPIIRMIRKRDATQ